jgi:FKBP-type peptidyl-prolyl cis-trans isomerase (trigger factor)
VRAAPPLKTLAELRTAAIPPLPEIGAVSLAQLCAPPLVEPPEPTPEAVLERYLQALREAAPRRALAEGEAISLGDDVELDVIAFAGSELVPFSFRHLWTTVLAGRPEWPGLFEALAGRRVGTASSVPVRLGQTAVEVTVVVHAAWEVLVPGAAEEAFALLGRADSFEGTLEVLCDELAQERLDAAQAARVEAVLQAFARGWSGEVPDALLEAEAQRGWIHAEGEPMVEAGIPPAVQSLALAQWLADEPTREKTRAHLRLELALRALGEAAPPSLSLESVLADLGPLAADLGFDEQQLRGALRSDRALATELARSAYRLSLVKRVLASAQGL